MPVYLTIGSRGELLKNDQLSSSHLMDSNRPAIIQTAYSYALYFPRGGQGANIIFPLAIIP